MARAVSVPSSTRALITGERAKQSTNLRPVNLPAIRVQPVDRHYFIARSETRVITDEAPLLWIWRERRSDVELEDLSNCRRYAARTGQEPLGSNIGALSFETAGLLLGRLLRHILILLRVRTRNKQLRLSAFDGVSSNRLVPPKPQGRLR
jgi:hypothetical protein